MDGKQQPSNRQKQSYKTPACDWNIPRKESQQDESRRWGLVLLWINETTSTSPPLMSRTTEIRLYEEQMASKRHNGAVRNQTELQWLHFQSIFINMEDEFFFPQGQGYIRSEITEEFKPRISQSPNNTRSLAFGTGKEDVQTYFGHLWECRTKTWTKTERGWCWP